jgi:hypothetical protein
MDFRVLGTLEIRDGAGRLLAVLLLRANTRHEELRMVVLEDSVGARQGLGEPTVLAAELASACGN